MFSKAETVLIRIFKICCIFVGIYMSAKAINKYHANNDISTISLKEFNASPEDKYPTYSICFSDEQNGGIYNSKYLEDNLTFLALEGTDIRKSYMNLLKGKYSNTAINTTMFSMIDHGKITLKKEESLLLLLTETLAGEMVDVWSPNLEPSPLFVSYQDVYQICFTRKTDFNATLIRNYDLIAFQLDKIKSYFPTNYSKDEVYIYLHYPGQLLRNFRKEAVRFDLDDLARTDRKTNQVTLSISFVSVLRRREDGNTRCLNANVFDEDTLIRQMLMEKIGCVPTYWKSLPSHSSVDIPDCNSLKQLQKFYEYLAYSITNGAHFSKLRGLMRIGAPPCNEMNLIYSTKNVKSDIEFSPFQVKIQYQDTKYQEIKNSRDWGSFNAWSSVAGFMGFFVGFSLLQIPDLLSKGSRKIKKNCKNI